MSHTWFTQNSPPDENAQLYQGFKVKKLINQAIYTISEIEFTYLLGWLRLTTRQQGLARPEQRITPSCNRMLNKQQQQKLKAATFPYNVKPTLWLTKNRPFFFSSREFHPLLLHQLWASKTTEKRKTKTKYKIIRKKTGEEKFPLLPMSLKQYLLELHFSSVFRKLPKNKNKAKNAPVIAR